jgi:hypothetical protein
MECPECKEQMQQLCMYGPETGEIISADWHCDKCGTLATLKWTPGKKARTIELFDYVSNNKGGANMKQQITVEQLNELSEEQKERLREWWKPKLVIL